MPDVLASHSMPIVAVVSQHGQRSVVSVPSVASESSSTGNQGNQDPSRRSVIASVHRALDWNHSPGVLGSNIILDDGGLGGEAPGLSTLLQ